MSLAFPAPIAALLMLASCTSSATPTTNHAIAACDGLEERIAALAEDRNFPGIAIAVSNASGPAWSFAHGVADLEHATPIDADDTMFRIGSTSKAITAYLLARLAQAGIVNLDAAIGETLPELPEAHRATTLRQLAGHLGGVRHYKSMQELMGTTLYPTSRDALGLFIGDPLIDSPGEAFTYSTYGYTLISAVLERKTGRHFLELLEDHVAPLGLDATRADTPDVKPPARTVFYYHDADAHVIGPEVGSSDKWAGGGLLSSVGDLARFGHSHFALPDHIQAALWSSQRTASGEATGYGMGWFVRDGFVEHPGGSLGGTTLLRIYPDRQLVIALAANLSFMGKDAFGSLPDQLAECFAGRGADPQR